MPKQMFQKGLDFTLGWVARVRRYSLILALAVLLSMGFMGTAVASQASSSNYGVDETQFGAGSALQDCSGSYCAQSAAGGTTVGGASSATYNASFGPLTPDTPALEVIVTGGNQDMGVLDTNTTGTAVDTISVLTYLSNGYVMQVAGAVPSQGVHNLDVPMGSPGNTPFTSQQGTEQFGMNLVANTAPAIGADPISQPDGTDVASSVVASRYSNPNEFAYIDGDILAQNNVGSGEVDYTLSMIMNVSNVTPGGRYSGTYSVVVTPTF